MASAGETDEANYDLAEAKDNLQKAEDAEKLEKYRANVAARHAARAATAKPAASRPRPTPASITTSIGTHGGSYQKGMESTAKLMEGSYSRYPGMFSTGGSYSPITIGGDTYKKEGSDYSDGIESLQFSVNGKSFVVKKEDGDDWSEPEPVE